MEFSSFKLRLSFIFINLIFSNSVLAQVGEDFPLWQEGYLDIHHINTGKGDAAFFMLPDGTTMLVDAGASNRPQPRIPHVKPDNSRTPGEWISRYIRHMMNKQTEQKLHYILLTHFHNDHMGEIYSGIKNSKSGAYMLTGITDVGENLPFDKVIDRAWPGYLYPFPLENETMKNYRQFLNWHKEKNGIVVEQFKVGQNDQISLVNNPDKYPDFEIRNIAANGLVWTGVEKIVRNHFPPLESLGDDLPSENMSSIAFRLSFGRFDYYTGGDLPGIPAAGEPLWHDMETPVGKAVGPVEVHVLNHHGYFDAANEFFLSALRPRIHIIHSHAPSHPGPTVLRRLLSTNIYPGPRDIFATNIMEASKIVLGSAIDQLQSQQGHIVIRVEPNGEAYKIFILDDSMESYKVNAVFGPYTCE